MGDIERLKRHLAEDRRAAILHAKARLRELRDLITLATDRVEDGELEGLRLHDIESSLRLLQTTVLTDAHAAYVQKELG